MDDVRYPIGRFEWKGPVSEEQRQAWIEDIAGTPARLRAAVAGLEPWQLDTPYRPGGWTLRQVAHHLPDSHMNAYIRFKLALTEDHPTVKPFSQDRWAELADYRVTPVEVSVALLEALHERWVALLRSLRPEDFQRTYFHPEHKKDFTLEYALGQFAWHGRHHVAQVVAFRQRMGW